MKELVDRYIKLRDAKAQLKAKHTAELLPLEEMLAKIEAAILAHCNEQGLEAIRTEGGTAYKTVRTSASVADWDATLRFIRENELWHMLERRVSKDAVVQWREANGDLPPGLNWREEITINVRRA